MDENKTLNEEYGLGPGWTPVEHVAPINPSRPPQISNPRITDSYLAGSISPSLQHDAYFVQTGYAAISSVASAPLMPVAQAGQAANNAGVQQTIKTVSVTVSSSVGGPTTAVQFNNGGALGGDTGFTFDAVTKSVAVAGDLNLGGSFNITGGIIISGGVSIGGNAVVTGFINSVTGFQFNGTAAVGHYLRGNGTEFVSATIPYSDITGTPQLPITKAHVASQWLDSYTSTTGLFTASQPAASDLTNGTTGTGAVALADSPVFTTKITTANEDLTGKVTKYNNIATVDNGIPSELGHADLTAQTAAKSATTLVTPAATGRFRISAYLKVTTPDGVSSTLGAVTITFTDGTDSVAQSMVMQMANQAGAAVTTNTGDSTTSTLTGTMFVYAKTGVAIQYAIAYTSNTPGNMAYAARLTCEAM